MTRERERKGKNSVAKQVFAKEVESNCRIHLFFFPKKLGGCLRKIYTHGYGEGEGLQKDV